jgi:hypothetical protein
MSSKTRAEELRTAVPAAPPGFGFWDRIASGRVVFCAFAAGRSF